MYSDEILNLECGKTRKKKPYMHKERKGSYFINGMERKVIS